ncbi:helix-turn-helix domain-containing protein [Cereibacter sediminicola]|uniref:helix-turn-helix domain-containing protein n=1 Tax=Cereibacter sediminicola TaxID=2584941 RepID=UPI0011A2C3B0|nr:helix-turn-helix transcriptional regulator [Cereibacter sediminicola]
MGSTPYYSPPPADGTPQEWDPAAGYPPEYVRVAIGRRIQAALDEKGWKQSELAKRAGVGRDSISLYIRGKNSPTHASLVKVARALGKDIGDIAPELKLATVERIRAAGTREADVELTSIGDGRARLRIDRIVSMSDAARILAILEKVEQ